MGLLLPSAEALEPDRLVSDFPRGLVILETERQCIGVDVWIANTPDRRSRGLMFVRHMEEHEGMLFLFGRSRTISMWMKNTFIPLDMVFIRSDETVASVAGPTTPESTRSIRSREPVSRVLELNGGFAQRHDLSPDQRIWLAWPSLDEG